MVRDASGAIRRRWTRRSSPPSGSLMGMPYEAVLTEVKKQGRVNARTTATRVIAGEQGAQRSVVVERRVVRRFGNDKRTGT